ncbi:MAG TPA: TIGR01777 family oxidoreductase [Methylomirabilota bacterium]|nr:TIGR01777 family oxidoreductase [Methylomirabilota bacterium]
MDQLFGLGFPLCLSAVGSGTAQNHFTEDMMNILMTGATGLVGTALVKTFAGEGHTSYRLTRAETNKRSTKEAGVFDVPWNPSRSEIGRSGDSSLLQVPADVDAVINLAGAPVVGGRWTNERKAVLRSSRVDTTRGLVSAIAKMEKKPRVLISASAIGYYGDRGDELVTEKSAPGTDFLAELAKEWENEAVKAEKFGVRVVLLRFGIILAKQGGALPKMMMPFKFGLGGKLGSGRQWTSWIALQDVVAIVQEALRNESWKGPVNLVAPQPMRNSDFTESLAKIMHRPAIFSAPAFALRLAMGEMAGTLLGGVRVAPEVLEQHGYRFLHANLDEALKAILG